LPVIAEEAALEALQDRLYKNSSPLSPCCMKLNFGFHALIVQKSEIARIEDFLLAMGGVFAFMGSQYLLFC
jgi:hypothetical protein